MNVKTKPHPKLKRAIKITGIIAAVIAVLLIIGVVLLTTYVDPWHEKVAAAGIVEKTAQVGEVNFNYAEGPDNGPALLLLNAQHMDWYSYSRVLPALSANFHVFAVDYPGHGKTTYPDDYALNADQIGGDLAIFIETVIGEPAFVTGNSSGGLLTVWLAANKPDLVKAIVLEDPPLFSSEHPRIKATIAYKSFTTCHQFLEVGGDDFLPFWVQSSKPFIEKNFGALSVPMIESAVKIYRTANPGKAVEIGFLPDTPRLLFRGMNDYDPKFGDAFYDGTWNAGFDHAAALQQITCPTLLVHANFEIMADGVLNGAMDQADADRVVSNVAKCDYLRVDAEHVTHLDKPDQFVQIIEDFFMGSEQ